MRLANETITVLNAFHDRIHDQDVYLGTTIKGASWYNRIAANVVDSGLKAANQYTVRIPESADMGGKAYVEPKLYKKEVRSRDPTECFTIQAGDVIVKGEVDAAQQDVDIYVAASERDYVRLVAEDGSRIVAEQTAVVVDSPAVLQKDYPEMFTVLGVTDNRRAPRAPHWKVVGT